MSDTVTDRKSIGATIAIRAIDVLLWGAIVIAVARLWAILTGIPVGLWNDKDTWVSPTALPQVLQFEFLITEGDPGKNEITLLPFWLRAVGASSIAIFTVMLVMVLRAARLIAARVMRSDPFSAQIPRRLRVTAVIVLLLTVLRLVVDILTDLALRNWQPEAGQFHSLLISTDLPSISLSLVLAAIVAWVLATAFDRGARLERETDGLV